MNHLVTEDDIVFQSVSQNFILVLIIEKCSWVCFFGKGEKRLNV